MGLAASQARFLQLTARKSNIEYQAQQINQERLALSEKMSQASNKYNDTTNNRTLTFSYNNGTGVQEIGLSYSNYKNYMNKQMEGIVSTQQQYYLVSTSGEKIIVANAEDMQKMIDQSVKETSSSNYQEALKKVNEAKDARKAALKDIESNNLLNAFNEWKDSGLTFNEAKKDKELRNAIATIQNAMKDPDTKKVATAAKEAQDELIEATKELDDIPQDDRKTSLPTLTPDDFTIVEDLDNVDTFQKAIREGIYYFATREEDDEGNAFFNTHDWGTLGGGAIKDILDRSDDAAAEAEFTDFQAKIQKKDKGLEMRLDQLETERSSIQTEIEAISKVIEKNIESSFKTFS